MNSSDSANGTLQRSVVVRSAIVIALIALSAALVVLWINSSEPEAKREGATKRTAMLVEVMKMKIWNSRTYGGGAWAGAGSAGH